MAGKYVQAPAYHGGVTRFDKAPQAVPERSRMCEDVRTYTAFNAGDIVPIACWEVLPSQSLRVRVDDVIRQTTVKFPTMGEMLLDIYAFFVPNRVVNKSWKNVQGENTAGSWAAADVSLVPLGQNSGSSETYHIPVGSVADYYGLPTQSPLPYSVVSRMHDLPFRGYLAIYNEYFRDQNYQPPIPFSRLNVYEGFLDEGADFNFAGQASDQYQVPGNSTAAGDYPQGAIVEALFGEGGKSRFSTVVGKQTYSLWKATSSPLKANKLHDALTSVLPSPQKGPDVTFSLSSDSVDVSIPSGQEFALIDGEGLQIPGVSASYQVLISNRDSGSPRLFTANSSELTKALTPLITIVGKTNTSLSGSVDLSSVSGISVDDLRTGIAIQQLYEIYGRGGTRYREITHSLFGIKADDPYSDIPQMLGHVRHSLDLYQTAQTSQSTSESPQGELAAFGYTAKGGFLFHNTFLEHGYVHVFAVVRHRNVYPSYLAPSWFRLNKLDYYTPVMANISEQPIMVEIINPLAPSADSTVFGYQEAWWDYRQHPDIVTGALRSGVEGSLSVWTYQDEYDESMSSADGDFMESNSQAVLDNTLAVQSSNGPQFKAEFKFRIENDFPGPVYSVPGLDQI